MESQPSRTDRFWRYGSLGLSVLLYLLSLPFDAFCSNGCHAGYFSLVMGPLLLFQSAANAAWLANPFLVAAWAALASATSRLAPLTLGLVAFAIAVSFWFQREIVTNEAGLLVPIMEHRIGYWLWLSSIAVCCFGGVATIELSLAYKNKE
ncbi:hypothetical protein [Bradyrhizobium sp. CB3481]|uniref:hypothetical protein n=1 Tax=Bradyrhizobium sp. CB3481 TaxID=3039158 RepID=UPI0024B16714|nr:hypothetical protein [Bradyrhizobium sp. CB3481]WFU17143.1 hypothetical protein QA643_01925 [Bradyrhizobium sp. CB3481]